jgi:hypothetical protein
MSRSTWIRVGALCCASLLVVHPVLPREPMVRAAIHSLDGTLVLFLLARDECAARVRDIASGRRVFVNTPWGAPIYGDHMSCDGSDPRPPVADDSMCKPGEDA